MRPDDNYAACSPGCGCDQDINQEPDEGSFLVEEETDA